jgi:cleavage and polyadenylation specificity factor subunit 2
MNPLSDICPWQFNARVPLQGAELEEYLQKERAAKVAQQALIARNQGILKADEDESNSKTLIPISGMQWRC